MKVIHQEITINIKPSPGNINRIISSDNTQSLDQHEHIPFHLVQNLCAFWEVHLRLCFQELNGLTWPFSALEDFLYPTGWQFVSQSRSSCWSLKSPLRSSQVEKYVLVNVQILFNWKHLIAKNRRPSSCTEKCKCTRTISKWGLKVYKII